MISYTLELSGADNENNIYVNVFFFCFFSYTSSWLMEELGHRIDQATTKQMEQQEKGENANSRTEGRSRQMDKQGIRIMMRGR